ncbi:cytochrome P450 4C1 isoform X2 [Bemisia tabaci]|uniref:cytochrome P450 4C1 isoform X2 n=1 Tax=Bemisia tabaci TaxID=7038 RepID=UPI003B27C300
MEILIPGLPDVTRTLLSVLCICLALIWGIHKWNRRHTERLASKFPGPTALPIVGNALTLLNRTHYDLLRIITGLCEEYGSPFKFWLGSKLVVFITKPEDIQIILNSSKTLGKDVVYKFFDALVGDGLATAPVEKWKKTRKILTPSFSPKNITRFVPLMNERARIIIEQMQQHCGSGVEIDFYPFFFTASFDTLCEASFGVQVDSQLGRSRDWAQVIFRCTPLLMERLFAPWLYMDYVYEKTSAAKEMKRRWNDFREFSNNGSETTAQTNCFVLLMLAIHPEYQEKVIEEQYNIFGNADRSITLDDLDKMEYLEQAIKETLRLYPVVPIFVRQAEEDTKLTQNYVLPAGATAVIYPFFTHYDTELWPEPHKFNPDNFTAEKMANRHKYAFIPFSGGARGCIGNKYSMIAMKTTLSIFIRQFRVSTTKKLEDIEVYMDVVLRCKGGWSMKLERRINQKS